MSGLIDRRIGRLLDAVYAEPAPFDTAESFARSNHDDIPELRLDELDAERILARLRWAVYVQKRAEPSGWLMERIARLDQAASRLRSREGQRRQ